jgi:enoyl-CoA hydratase/carnithine racemase
VYMASGRYAEARAHIGNSLRLAAAGGYSLRLIDALSILGQLVAQEGQLAEALALLTLVVDHPVTPDDTQKRALQLCAALAQQLSPQQVAAAQERARSKGLEATLEPYLAP